MNRYLLAQLLIFALGVGWSLIFFLGKYTLRSIHKKMDANFGMLNRSREELKESAQKRDRRIVRAVKSFSASTSRQVNLMRVELGKTGKNLKVELSAIVARRNLLCRKSFVSRQEFGAFAVNINHKIDSMCELLKKKGGV